ncbi:MAG: hypothetical protein P8P29_04390 [Flavobacteriaceae bacterium]|nr:hypothetical protein [Flavobacteriaceae bacterium]
MARIITIKPKPNSKKFFSSATQYRTTKDQNGAEKSTSAGTYKGERFPNSRQMFRPKWSSSKRMWVIKSYEGNDEPLSELVPKCKLKYAKKHRREGEYITEADIYDFSDPFFTHKLLKVVSKEGQITLDKDRPFDKIILRGMMADPVFQAGLKSNGMLSSRVKYIVSDKDQDVKLRKQVRSVKREAYKLFEALNYKKKIKIALIMNVIVGSDIDPDMLDDALFRVIDNDKDKIGKKTKQQFFIDTCNSTTEELDFEHMLVLAKRGAHLRKRKNGFELFGSFVGKDMNIVRAYLKSEENQDAYMRLIQVLDESTPVAPATPKSSKSKKQSKDS